MLTSKAKGKINLIPDKKQKLNKDEIDERSLELAYLSYNIFKLKSKAKTKEGQNA